MSVRTVDTWSGLTARIKTLLLLATSELELVARPPTSFTKDVEALRLGSLASTSSAVTSPARMKPLARAVAILPAPRKPIVNLEGMQRLVTGCYKCRKRKKENVRVLPPSSGFIAVLSYAQGNPFQEGWNEQTRRRKVKHENARN